MLREKNNSISPVYYFTCLLFQLVDKQGRKTYAEANDKNTRLTSFFFREDNSKIIVVKIFTISFQNLSANSFVTEGNSTVVEENKLTMYI